MSYPKINKLRIIPINLTKKFMVLVTFHIIIEPIKQPGLSQQSICLLYTELTQKSTKNFYIMLFLSKDRLKHHRKS